MILYVNGQDIGGLVLGGLEYQDGVWRWSIAPQASHPGPEDYLAVIDAFLAEKKFSLEKVKGFVVIQGPGSPTALRGAHALINALAFTRSLPIYSLEKAKEAPDEGILVGLMGVQPKPYALPVYGTDPHITKSNKDALKRVISHGE